MARNVRYAGAATARVVLRNRHLSNYRVVRGEKRGNNVDERARGSCIEASKGCFWHNSQPRTTCSTNGWHMTYDWLPGPQMYGSEWGRLSEPCVVAGALVNWARSEGEWIYYALADETERLNLERAMLQALETMVKREPPKLGTWEEAMAGIDAIAKEAREMGAPPLDDDESTG